MSVFQIVLAVIVVIFVAVSVISIVTFQKRKQSHHTKSNSNEPQWYAETVDSVFEALSTSPSGLASDEVEKRQQHYGLNCLPEQKPRSPLVRFLYQFHNILIYVLLIAGVTTVMLGHLMDASVIFGVVIVNAIIGFIQEGKAEDALNAIRKMLSPNAIVMRQGKQRTIPAEELVPGDIVLLQSGDRVPADLRLFRTKSLLAQEAALTGESVAIEKRIDPVAKASVLGDRLSMAFSGTLITHGQGSGIVVSTGAHTEIGMISMMVANVETVTTPLIQQISDFGRLLTFGILVIAALTFLLGVVLHGYSYTDMFLAAVSLAVAAIPEGLPAIITITLAIGVQRMASRNAIIRKLPAVETLGAVSVICSDKTGTLTRNEMTVKSIINCGRQYNLTGIGYDPHGAICIDNTGNEAEDNQQLQEILYASMLCNDAALEQDEGNWKVHGDPMEGALIVAGMKGGLDDYELKQQFPRTDLIPFESEHSFMATLHHSHTGEAFIYIKGAPEHLLERCKTQRSTEGEETLNPDYWHQQIHQLASQGMRVLGIATRRVNAEQLELNFDDVADDLVMLGLIGMIDPPRDEAIAAVKQCKSGGIRVKMITGDHATTALAIAKQLQLVNTTKVLTGHDLEKLSEQELCAMVKEVDVYARVDPEHKLLLVRLLQDHGLIVAMTGDGVNDAPALKRADVGTAMGKNGTEAAKEAAEMVLADDNFASIIHAVEEGRTVYDNIRKSIIFILPTNGGEALVIFIAVVFGFQHLPLTPVMILWVNMITAVTLALSLAFEPSERNIMQRKPRNSREPILSVLLVWRIVFVSFILMIGTVGLFQWEMSQGATIEYSRTVAVNTLVMFEIFYLFNSRYIRSPVLHWQGLTGNRYVLMAIALLILFQLIFTYTTPMQQMFGTVAINMSVWFNIVVVSSSVLFLVEIEKYIINRIENRTSQLSRI